MDYAFKKQIIEALIFASDTPISDAKLIQIVEELEQETLRKVIEDLNQEYHDSHRSFLISMVGGGYQIVTRPEYSPWLKQMFRGKIKTRLTQASLEVLAIIAFKQPISRPQIDAIRGANCDGVVKNLLERNLIEIAGRADSVGKPLLYKTTEEFLRYFGINEITDLPKPKEINELIRSEDSFLESVQVLSSQMGQRDLFNTLEAEDKFNESGGDDDVEEVEVETADDDSTMNSESTDEAEVETQDENK